jgi:tetratricopeptide (TPR) repeat protein
VAAIRSFEGAAQCFENSQNFEKAAQCYADTASLIIKTDRLKAAEMFERAAQCIDKVGGSSHGNYLQAATIFKDHAVRRYKESPDQGLQLLQKAAENFERGGNEEMATQCYDVGAEASLNRKDYLNAVVFYGIAGQSFERHKKYKKAIKYYHKVANLWEDQNVPENVAENYLRMAGCLDILKEYRYSTQFFIKAAEKYDEAQETYKSARAYEKAAHTLELEEELEKAAECYSKSAELVKSLKNLDKFEELYNKAAQCCVKTGEHEKSVKIHLLLAETFSDDPYRCSNHFDEAIASAESNPHLKVDLLTKQGEILIEAHDYLKAARSYEDGAEISENLGEDPSECYERAGRAYVLFVKSMVQVKNQRKAREGYELAVTCFEKAGIPEEAEQVRQIVKPDTTERENQIRDELNRLRKDLDNGLLSQKCFQQIKEGYEELVKRLKQ